MTSRPANIGTKALAWTELKLVIYLPDSALMTFWVHTFLVQYGFDVEVNLGSRKSILDVTSTPPPPPTPHPTSTTTPHVALLLPAATVYPPPPPRPRAQWS